MSNSLQPHGLQHPRPPCPSPAPGVYSNSCPLNQWCHPTISSSVVPFSSCLQSFPASGSFQMSQLFASGGQSIGVSASTSVLPVNTQVYKGLSHVGTTHEEQAQRTSDPGQRHGAEGVVRVRVKLTELGAQGEEGSSTGLWTLGGSQVSEDGIQLNGDTQGEGLRVEMPWWVTRLRFPWTPGQDAGQLLEGPLSWEFGTCPLAVGIFGRFRNRGGGCWHGQ